jgi:hypothetical protein
MVDVSAFASAIASLKTAGDIAKAMIGLHDAQAVKAKIIELQTEILSAQQSALSAQSDQFALLERMGQLEKQIAQLEAWEVETQRYQLSDVGMGRLAYTLKPETAGFEPPHSICAACFQHRKKSILQPDMDSWWSTLVCPECKTVIRVKELPINIA